MNVLFITFADSQGAGGTSVATQRLHNMLSAAGHRSRFLCRQKFLPDGESARIPRSRILEKALGLVFGRTGLNDLHAVSSFFIDRHRWFREAEIVHYHSIHSGYFNYAALPQLTREKPSVWTLHDMWAVSGHCSFPYDCTRWETGCGRCPHLDTYPAVRRDATALEWRLKKRAYSKARLTITVTSRWQEDIVRRSLLSHFPVVRIPYGVKTDYFTPAADREAVRAQLGLPAGKKMLLFLSGGRLMDPRKGADHLIAAVSRLPESLRKEIFIASTGGRSPADPSDLGAETHFLGTVPHEQMPLLFQAADLFVFPTRAETFGMVAIESMACGTPVLASDLGPLRDHVRHNETGWRFEPENPAATAAALERLLTDDALRRRLGETGRKIAVEEYSEALQLKRVLALYESVLKPPSGGYNRGSGETHA